MTSTIFATEFKTPTLRGSDRPSSWNSRPDRRSELDLWNDHGDRHSIFSHLKSPGASRTLTKEVCPVCNNVHKIIVLGQRTGITCSNGDVGEKWFNMQGTKSEDGFWARGRNDSMKGVFYRWISAEKVRKWAELQGSESKPETTEQRLARQENADRRNEQIRIEAANKLKAEIEALLTPRQMHNAVLSEMQPLNRAEIDNLRKRLAFLGGKDTIEKTIAHLEQMKVLGHVNRGHSESLHMGINATIDGLLHLGQVATSFKDSKYVWNNKIGYKPIVNRVKATNYRPHMAIPQLSPENPDFVYVTEGFLRIPIAQILANNAGVNVAMMGVAGCSDWENPNLLKAAAQYPDASLILVPDWDCGNNTHVNKALLDIIKKDRYDGLLWIGQGTGRKRNIDDLTIAELQAAEILQPDEFLDRLKVQEPLEEGVTLIDLDDFESVKKAYLNEPGKIKVNISEPGGGKSFYLGLVVESLLGTGKKAVCASSNYRNPTTPAIAALPELSGRHVATKFTNDTITVATQAELDNPSIPTVIGNCFQAATIALAGHHGLIENSVQESFCKACPLFGKCITSTGADGGRGYGFLSARNQAIKGSHRLAPQSLPSPDSDRWDDPNWELYIDESTGLEAILFKDVTVDRTAGHRIKSRLLETDLGKANLWAVDRFLSLLNDVSHHGLSVDSEQIQSVVKSLDRAALLAIEPLLQTDLTAITEQYGMSRAELKEIGLDARMTPEEFKLVLDNAIPRFIPGLISVLDGRGAVEAINGEIKITTPTQYADAMLKTGVTLLDATPNMARLEAIFGKENIEVYSSRSMVGAKVKVTKILGSKNATQRTDANQTFNRAIVEALATQEGRKVAVIDRKVYLPKYSDRVIKMTAFSESRGSNKAFDKECNTLVIVGGFNANINALRTEHHLYSQDCQRQGMTAIGFDQYYQANKDREMAQAFGRLRANRRSGENLEIFVVDDSYEGHYDQALYPEQVIQDAEKLHGKSRTIMKIATALKEMINSGDATTLRAIGKLAGVSHQTVANHWAAAWALIATNESIVDSCEGHDGAVLEAILICYLEAIEQPPEDEELEWEVYEYDDD